MVRVSLFDYCFTTNWKYDTCYSVLAKEYDEGLVKPCTCGGKHITTVIVCEKPRSLALVCVHCKKQAPARRNWREALAEWNMCVSR